MVEHHVQGGSVVVDGRTRQLQRRGIERDFDPVRDAEPEFGINRLQAERQALDVLGKQVGKKLDHGRGSGTAPTIRVVTIPSGGATRLSMRTMRAIYGTLRR
jgi:hypothetical protein